MKHFIVCTNSAVGGEAGANAAERNSITEYLKQNNRPVWHWFEDIWLVLDQSEESHPKKLRDELRALIDQRTHIVVMEIEPEAFSGFGNTKGWPWMSEYWGRSE